MPTQTFIIKTASGKTLDHGPFDTFEEARNFLYQNYPNDADVQAHFIDMLEKD